jgi:hypothetical protein
MPSVPLPYAYSITQAGNLVDVMDQDRDSQLTNIVNALNIVTARDVIDETTPTDNVFSLASQDFEVSFSIRKPFTTYGGLAGCVSTRQAIVEKEGIIDGVHFRGPDVAGALIKITSTGIVLFRNCTFELTNADDASAWIVVETGARAIFMGCMWRGTPSAGWFIQHTGALANVQVVGSYATATAPGPAFGNSTLTAVL